MSYKYSIYICHTLFNLFVTLIRVISGGGENIVVFLPDNIKFVPHRFVGKYIKQLVIYPNVKIKNEWNLYKKGKRHPFFNYKKELISLVEKIFEAESYHELFCRSDFFVFNDGVPFVSYLMLKYSQQHFTLIEEGELTYSTPRLGFRYFIKKVMGYPPALGYSRCINRLEVRYPERLPVKTRKKAGVMDIDYIMNKLDEGQRKELFEFFNFDSTFKIGQERPSLLLLPQPLSEDGIITENEKQELYKDIVSSYLLTHHIYVKPHPKEMTNYSKIISSCTVLSKDSPSELFHFSDVKFDLVITLFSTSIHAIPAEERIFLGLDYAPNVKIKWMKKMDVKNKH